MSRFQKNSSDVKYLHGFTKKEQDRLYFQSQFLKEQVFRYVDFHSCKHIIEIGCGVGAQTEILLEKFPHAEITSVDASEKQLERARERFKKHPQKNQVRFIKGDAKNLNFNDMSFDAAFICWLLEHVPGPAKVVKEAHRVLRIGGKLFCNEVLNNTFFVDPYSPAIQKVLFEFNDYQWEIAGDPFVGAKLGVFLDSAKFKNISVIPAWAHYDHREVRRRKDFIELFRGIFMSAAPDLVKQKRVTPALVKQLNKELAGLKGHKEAIIYYSWMQAFGTK